ncbi:MAG: iron ABC transporter permease [Lentisphaerae bacterium]|nr:iron ABC transporter permease [Lentisphaerota bacterium]
MLSLFFAVFLLLPVGTVIAEGCSWQIIVSLWENPVYRGGLINSFLLAILTTLLVFVLALPLALLSDRYDFRGKGLWNAMILAPMILPPFVGALGFQQIFGYYGVLNTIITAWGGCRIDFLGGDGKFFAVALIEALHLYPILYLNLAAALANCDPALNEAARNLGASVWRRFFTITLPLIRPGILAGGSLVLIWSFTELGTPLMFGFTRVTPVQVFDGLSELESNPMPYALVLVMMIVSSLLYLAGRLLTGGSGASAVKGASTSVAQQLTGIKAYLPGIFFGAVTIMAILPHIALLLIAFSQDYYGTILPGSWTLANFQNALGDKLVVPSIFNSLRYSLTATLLAVTAGTLCAVLVVRWKVRGAVLFDLLSMLPLAIPGIVMAFGFLGMTVKFSWASAIFDPVNSPLWLLAGAYAIRRIPYVVRSVASGLEQTPVVLEEAALSVGASRQRVFFKILAPLLTANLLIGGLFAFSFSMLEVSDSLVLVQKSAFYPITKAIFELSQVLGAGGVTASAFGVWTMVFMAATLGAASAILGKKLGALFRF